MYRRTVISAAVGAMLCGAASAAVDVNSLDRGHRLLLDYGLQLQGLVLMGPGSLDEERWAESNFTTHHFVSDHWTNHLPNLPTRPWARWATPDPATINWNTTYWVTASEFDELNIEDIEVRQQYADWLEAMRKYHPHVISHTTQGGNNLVSGGAFGAIRRYMRLAKPDMLFFDDYAFEAYGRPPWPGGSPTLNYSNAGLFRFLSLHGSKGKRVIPFGMWIQTYKPQPSNHIVSESEISIQYFTAWAYGMKAIAAFTYATHLGGEEVGSVLFDGHGDENPSPLFFHTAELNRQSRNLGPTLLRLLTADVRHVPGLNAEGPNIVPDLEWDSDADPFITNIEATNLGVLNDQLRGDVVVGYFNPLLEQFDGPDYEDELYFMIVNGLTDRNGTGNQTAQRIHLDFDFGDSGINSLQRLSRDSGEVEVMPLVPDSGSLYHLDLVLDGGIGDLFKFNTGAAFIGPEPVTQSDFDFDFDVDGDDFLVWQNHFPSASGAITVLDGDADLDDDVDGDDFLIWQNHFPFPAALSPVPEPNSLMLLALGTTGGLGCRQRSVD